MALLARTLVLLGIIFASSACDPVRPEDRLCQVGEVFAGDTSSDVVFAGGYFPQSYAEPKAHCGPENPSRPLIGEVESEWYPEQLTAACEPSLLQSQTAISDGDFVFRFSYIPSFHASVFIRVEKKGTIHHLIVKEMTGAGGYDPGLISRSKEFYLTDKQIDRFNNLLFGSTLLQETPATCGTGFDGSEWLFELADAEGYRLVKRWSPADGAGHDLGVFLMELTGWGFADE